MLRTHRGASKLCSDRQGIHTLNTSKRLRRRRIPQICFAGSVMFKSKVRQSFLIQNVRCRSTRHQESNHALKAPLINRKGARAAPDNQSMTCATFIIAGNSGLLRIHTSALRRRSKYVTTLALRRLDIGCGPDNP